MRGQFTYIFPPEVVEFNNLPDSRIVIPNTVVDTGEEQFLRAVVRNEAMGLTGGPPTQFYVGLCNQVITDTTDLAGIVSEPTIGVGAYARQVVERDSTGWPTIDVVAGQYRAVSKLLTFTATGADFDASFTQAFLCSVATGTVGNLFAVSGALTVPVLILATQSFQLQYELFSS